MRQRGAPVPVNRTTSTEIAVFMSSRWLDLSHDVTEFHWDYVRHVQDPNGGHRLRKERVFFGSSRLRKSLAKALHCRFGSTRHRFFLASSLQKPLSVGRASWPAEDHWHMRCDRQRTLPSNLLQCYEGTTKRSHSASFDEPLQKLASTQSSPRRDWEHSYGVVHIQLFRPGPFGAPCVRRPCFLHDRRLDKVSHDSMLCDWSCSAFGQLKHSEAGTIKPRSIPSLF